MTIGGSIFLIALGAILKFAVTYTVAGLDINTVGVILMVTGAIGLIIGLFLLMTARRRVVDPRVAQPVVGQPVAGQPIEPVVYEDPRPPAPPTY